MSIKLKKFFNYDIHMSLLLFYNESVKRRKVMFEKIFNGLFCKPARKTGITVISKKREITENFSVIKKTDYKSVYDKDFWENRGRFYGALFKALRGRAS